MVPSPAELNDTTLSFFTSTPATFIACANAMCAELPGEVPTDTLSDDGSLRRRSSRSLPVFSGESARTTTASYSTPNTASGVKSA